MNIRAATLVVIGLVAVGGLIYPLVARRDDVRADPGSQQKLPVVQTQLVAAKPMRRTVRLRGDLRSGSEATVSPKQGGRILAVLVSEGETVHTGQLLVRLDPSDQRRQAEQAVAGATAARANWEKAKTGERLKRLDVERRISDAKIGVEQAQHQLDKALAGIKLQGTATSADVDRAQAGVDAAKSQLAQAKRGARPEQRKQAEIAVGQAERGVALAKKNLGDLQFLFDHGGVPRVQLDEAQEGYDKARDGLAQAQAQRDLLNAGAGKEEIAAAEAQVRSAEAGLKAAKAAANRGEVDSADIAAARTQVQQAQDGLQSAKASRQELTVSAEDVTAARAAYDQALAASKLTQQQVESAEITSPAEGLVTAVNAHVGEMSGPGQPLVTVTSTKGVYLDAAAPSRMIADLRAGQEATVFAETLPSRRFSGRVHTVGAAAGPDGRSYPVRVDFTAPAGELKPGGLAQADVVVEAYQDAPTVPVDALRANGTGTVVWVVRAGKVVSVPVEIPIQDSHSAMVKGSVRAGEPVVVAGDVGIRPGDAVRAQPEAR